MNTFLIGAGAFIVGLVLGVAGEWRLLKSWVQLALDQSAVLHTDEKTPRHAPRAARPLHGRTRRPRRPQPDREAAVTPDLFLQLGAAAVFGAVVMAVALICGMRPRKAAAQVVETPTAEHDPLVEHFNQACNDLLPLFLPDYRGMPLGDTEERILRDIERGQDPDFAALFNRDTET
jgi:hypothetical protein